MLQSKRVFQAIFLSYSTLLLLGLSDNIRGPLFPEILKAFSLTDSEGSLFFVLTSLSGFFGGLSSHRFEKRWGTLVTLRMAVLLMAISQLLLSVAPNYGILLLASILFGGSLGVMGVFQNLLLVQTVPKGPFKNKVLAGLHSTYAGASLLGPLIVNAVTYLDLPVPLWRACFVVTSLFGAGILALTFRGPRLQVEVPEPPILNGNEKLLDSMAKIYFAVMLASYVLAEIMVSSRMALYTRREFGASLTDSSWYTAGFFGSLLLSRVLFTVWSPPLKLKTQLVLCLLMTVVSLIFGIAIHPMGLALAGFFMGPFYPMMMVAIGHLFSHSVSQALSWAVGLSSLFVVLMHFSVGYITEAFSLQTAFYFGPGFCVLSLTMLVLYEKVFRRLQPAF